VIPGAVFWLFLCGFVVCAESARLDRVNAVVVGECAEGVQALLSGAQQLLEGDSKHAADETAVDSEGSAVDGGGERAAQVGNEVRDLLRIDEPFNE
jgi:hypothetical protein